MFLQIPLSKQADPIMYSSLKEANKLAARSVQFLLRLAFQIFSFFYYNNENDDFLHRSQAVNLPETRIVHF